MARARAANHAASGVLPEGGAMPSNTRTKVGAAVSPPASCNVRPCHGASWQGSTWASHRRRSSMSSTPPMAAASAAMLAATSPS